MVEISYALAIFIYVFLRIKRDTMIVAFMGQEGTSLAKLLSLIVLLGLSFVLQKLLSRFFSKKSIWIGSLIVILLIIILLQFKFINYNNGNIIGYESLLMKLLSNKPIVITYILSEMFAFLLSSQFWGLINSTNNSKFNVFLVGQFGLLAASTIYMIANKLEFLPIIIVIPILIVLCLKIFKNNYENNHNSQCNNDHNHSKNSLKLGPLIPITTLLCGITAGLLDPFAKYKVSMFCHNNHYNYSKFLPLVWILQSIFTIIANYLFYKHTKFWITSLFLICGISTIIVANYINLYLMLIIIVIIIIGFKVLKYSSHSPLKEQYLGTDSQLLFYDSIAGRFGKNAVAIILSGLFIYGYNWNIIGYYVIFILILICMLWFYISYKIQKSNDLEDSRC